MKKVNLPTEDAKEPEENARQPQQQGKAECALLPMELQHKIQKNSIPFDTTTQFSEKSASQSSTTTYKDVLSQPTSELSHRQRMLWLQSRRTTGLWAQCDDCERWRYLPHVLDSKELPRKWYCRLNPDTNVADCSIPEAPLRIREEEDLIHSEYSAGSMVWARMPGWPWWPAMVDDCPDTEQFYWLDGFSDIPTHYNVVFFDAFDVTRAWIPPEQLKPYGSSKDNFKHFLKDKKYKKRLEVAVKQADDAEKLPLPNRLAKYSFISRYPGAINNPTKISKTYLKKFQNQLKRKYDVEFPDDNVSESDEDTAYRSNKEVCTRNNIILLGTPKKPKVLSKATNGKKDKHMPNTTNIRKNVSSKTPQKPTKETTRNDQDEGTEQVKKGLDNAASSEEMSNQVETQNRNDESELFKEPNSMVVQIGSTVPSALVDGPLDSNVTFVPETESEAESEYVGMKDAVKNIQIRIASPSSDDFDF